MQINKNIASKIMALFHAPSSKERSESLSRCHICLLKEKLTREHIPPEKAFNDCTKLWDRLVLNSDSKTIGRVQIKGGLWVKTLCGKCNNDVCSPYAKEYVRFVKQLVESPKLFDGTSNGRIISVKANPLFLAKQIVTMILAIEDVQFAKHHPELRSFVMDPILTINPPFDFYAFLVPEVPEAGTVLRFHARVDTYAPGFGFAGGEISWFPFGIIYCSRIDSGYYVDKLTKINNWFSDKPPLSNSSFVIKLYQRITGVDSIQCVLGQERVRPQIDRISEKYV